jgi:hypothetical protein
METTQSEEGGGIKFISILSFASAGAHEAPYSESENS